MFDQLIKLITGAEDTSSRSTADNLQLAVAALLVEAARMDDNFVDTERAAVTALLEKRFEMSKAQVAELIEQAEAKIEGSAQYFPFTHEITTQLDNSGRIEIIEMLWSVVLADGEVDPYEDMLIRKISGLIYVSDRDRALARQRAKAKTEAG